MHLRMLQATAVHEEACKSSAGVSYGTASICNICRAWPQWPVDMLPLHAATAAQVAACASHAMRLGGWWVLLLWVCSISACSAGLLSW